MSTPTDEATGSGAGSPDVPLTFEVASFLYREAQLLDDRRFRDWLDLFTADGVYLVPTDSDVADPENHVNIAFEGRVALEDRVARLESGFAHAQDPPSRTIRAVTNVVAREGAGGMVSAKAVLTIAESRLGKVSNFAAHVRYDLARVDGGQFQIKFRRLDLVNADSAHGNITFVL